MASMSISKNNFKIRGSRWTYTVEDGLQGRNKQSREEKGWEQNVDPEGQKRESGGKAGRNAIKKRTAEGKMGTKRESERKWGGKRGGCD
jgi:hypothetical protein